MNTKNSDLLSSIEMNPESGQAQATIIWMHGLGASADDFVPIVPALRDFSHLNLRFVFPYAPQMPVTVNNGFVMPAWYDITSFDKKGAVDLEGIKKSIKQIHLLVDREIAQGFQYNQIILAGFSQGAVMALSTLVTFEQELGGVIALSGYLPPVTDLFNKKKHTTPIFLGHGLYDDVVPFMYGELAHEHLKEAKYPVVWHPYPIAHSVSEQEVADIAKWLKEKFSK